MDHNMTNMEGLYYFVKDGLKDSWEHNKYAKKAMESKDTEVAKYHIEEGLHRIERMKVVDRLFKKKMTEYKYEADSLFKMSYDDLISDAEYLEQCFIKMKTKV